MHHFQAYFRYFVKMCVICVTQDGDAGAISSPFFQLCMMSQRAVGKTRETPVTLCFILTHLY